MRFWEKYQRLIKDVALDYQYLIMLDEADVNIEKERDDQNLPSDRSQAITNFKIAAGLEEGEHYGWWFQDTDVYKWIETVAYTLKKYPDSKLEARTDKIIDVIELAQEESGYLSTYYQLKEPELKYQELHHSHELYNAGHLIEAAIAYDQSTGNDKLLKVALRFVDNIRDNFGWGQIEGADGHQEVELALIKLYEYTGNTDYLELSSFFIEVRGKDTTFYDRQNIRDGSNIEVDLEYLQAYTQPINQTEAKGHAVRMLYMLEAMIDLSYYNNDYEMKETVERLWKDIIEKKIYVTGAVGQTVHGEAFLSAYDLSNDTMYCETCASVALANTARKYFRLNQDNKAIDIMERALYNGMLAGMSQDGKHYFYVNPLEYTKGQKNPNKGHVKGVRPEWLGCACCPPNLTRTVANIDTYFYSRKENEIFIHLYGDGVFEDADIKINQESEFPRINRSKFKIEINNQAMTINFRMPEWAQEMSIMMDDKPIEQSVKLSQGRYNIDVKIDHKPLRIYSNDRIVNNRNKVAFQYGPLIYCSESIDQRQNIYQYRVTEGEIKYQWIEDELAIRNNLIVPAICSNKNTELYRYDNEGNTVESQLVLIPYYLWANRKETDMQVWHLEAKGE